MKKILIGWEEWCSLPELHLPAIKTKIDTGAKTSSLHAFNIRPFTLRGAKWVRFSVNPLQDNEDLSVICQAAIVDKRAIMNSGGRIENRYVISTTLVLGKQKREIELTLTNRSALAFRMLLGRAAMQDLVTIDPAASCCQGKFKKSQLNTLYKAKR